MNKWLVAMAANGPKGTAELLESQHNEIERLKAQIEAQSNHIMTSNRVISKLKKELQEAS